MRVEEKAIIRMMQLEQMLRASADEEHDFVVLANEKWREGRDAATRREEEDRKLREEEEARAAEEERLARIASRVSSGEVSVLLYLLLLLLLLLLLVVISSCTCYS
jgi:hypothetical protein